MVSGGFDEFNTAYYALYVSLRGKETEEMGSSLMSSPSERH
jgi:hypothetical protein